MNQRHFTIVGSGLAGTLMACYLARAGHRVDVYEKRPDPRRAEQERGRSINLALSVRGIHALQEVGLADEVLHAGILMRGRMIHPRNGKLTFQPYGKDDTEALHSVSRSGLNLLLVQAAARYDSVRLFFEHRCTGYDPHDGVLEFAHQTKVATEVVIAADGAYSAVRSQLQRQEGFNYRQDYLSHGYKELTIPPGPGGSFLLEPNALHIWPRGNFMMIALPNADGSFTGTLFWPFQGPNSFAALTAEKDVIAYFQDQFPDAMPLIPTLGPQFLHNPTGSLVTIRCQPWHVNARAVLLGDACHAVVPFLGQGMNAAFEDCSVLNRCLAEEASDPASAFATYEALRKENLDTLADLCVENFYEMRDRVGSPWFVLRKTLEIALHALFPRWYLPLYTMIEFTRMPYAAALRRAKWQDRIVVAVGIGIILLLIAICIAAGLWVRIPILTAVSGSES
jgi:kynurenine 3-monooxygenase